MSIPLKGGSGNEKYKCKTKIIDAIISWIRMLGLPVKFLAETSW